MFFGVNECSAFRFLSYWLIGILANYPTDLVSTMMPGLIVEAIEIPFR